MPKKLFPDTAACKTCTAGSCCYEGAELSAKELRKIVKFNPNIPKPWFRLVEKYEEPEGEDHFTTLIRNGSCVFHDKNNRCMVYKVRPKHCRDFPVQDGKAAPYYKRLCVLFHEEWPANSSLRRILKEREKI